jgi:hypothetical protein
MTTVAVTRGLSKGRVTLFVLVGMVVAALSVMYGAYLTEDGGRSSELRILGGWLLSVVGLGTVLATQIASIPPRTSAADEIRPALVDPDVPGWRSQLFRPALALISAGAGLVHFVVIREHLEEALLFGLFFIGLSAFQFAWAMAVVLRRQAFLLWVALAVNLVTIVIWVVSRTVGLPIGPETGEAIEPGFGDAVATAFEVLLVTGIPLLLSSKPDRGPLRLSVATTMVSLIALLIVVVTAFALISSAGGSIFVPPAG